MRTRFIGAVALAAACLSTSACASMGAAVADFRYGNSLADMTAPQFNLEPSQVEVTWQRATGQGTNYGIRLPDGREMTCFHDGKGWALMSNPPRCGDQAGVNPLTGN
jgi:hypothetical protein